MDDEDVGYLAQYRSSILKERRLKMTMSMTARQRVSYVPMKTRNGARAKYREESFQLAAPLRPDGVLPDGVRVEVGRELELELELEMGKLMPFESSELELESLFNHRHYHRTCRLVEGWRKFR